MSDLPYPPYELATRVGTLDDADDPWAFYDWLGAATRAGVEAALPPGWDMTGKRVLDFGCGAGRTLRRFVADEVDAELCGCDIDAASIEWLQEHLSPPLEVFRNDELPPLPQPDASFDLVYCVSVFTHLTRSWSAWLLELHRILKPDGLLVATFMGEGQSMVIANEEWDEDRVGMLVLAPGQSWDRGGPMVLHSPWWIRAHWGRLFEIVSLEPHGFASEPGTGHGTVTMRRRDVRLTPADLERPEPGEPREAIALAHNVDRLVRELEHYRPLADRAIALDGDGEATPARVAELEQRLRWAEGHLATLASSKSWTLTRPLRLAAEKVRAVRR